MYKMRNERVFNISLKPPISALTLFWTPGFSGKCEKYCQTSTKPTLSNEPTQNLNKVKRKWRELETLFLFFSPGRNRLNEKQCQGYRDGIDQ